MLEARLTKAVVVFDNKLNTNLMAVAEYCDEALNIRVQYDWNELDHEGFLTDLRDTIAKEFDIPTYHVHVDNDKILRMMEFFNMRNTGLLQ